MRQNVGRHRTSYDTPSHITCVICEVRERSHRLITSSPCTFLTILPL